MKNQAGRYSRCAAAIGMMFFAGACGMKGYSEQTYTPMTIDAYPNKPGINKPGEIEQIKEIDIEKPETDLPQELAEVRRETIATERVEAQAVSPMPEADMEPTTLTPMKKSPAGSVQTWNAAQGRLLEEVLASWSRNAGVEFIWNTPETFRVQESMTFTGEYEDAVAALIESYRSDAPVPGGRLHVNPASGEKVLVIESF